jgi:hypothetical protein
VDVSSCAWFPLLYLNLPRSHYKHTHCWLRQPWSRFSDNFTQQNLLL